MAVHLDRFGTPRGTLLDTLARLSHGPDFPVGCYCENFRRCHRSILGELLRELGARLAIE